VKSTEEATKFVTWCYFCNDDNGQTGSLLTSEETTKEDALVVANRICTDRRKQSNGRINFICRKALFLN
jgi:galactose-1-phosphate uridylyltransferase